MAINENILSSFRDMVGDLQTVEELNDFVSGLEDPYKDALEEDIEEKRDDLTVESSAGLENMATAEIVEEFEDLIDDRPHLREAFEEKFYEDEESDSDEKDTESEEDNTKNEEDNTESGEDDSATDEEDADDTSEEDNDTDEDDGSDEDDEDNEEDANGEDDDAENEEDSLYEGLPVTDDDFDAESAQENIEDWKDDKDVDATGFFLDDGQDIPVVDIVDGEPVIPKEAIDYAEKELDEDAPTKTKDRLKELYAHFGKAQDTAASAVRESLVNAAERSGIENPEDMSVPQLALSLDEASSESSHTVTDRDGSEPSARELIGVLTDRNI